MLATGDTAGRNAADASPGHVSRQDEQGPQKKKKRRGQPRPRAILGLGPQAGAG